MIRIKYRDMDIELDNEQDVKTFLCGLGFGQQASLVEPVRASPEPQAEPEMLPVDEDASARDRMHYSRFEVRQLKKYVSDCYGGGVLPDWDSLAILMGRHAGGLRMKAYKLKLLRPGRKHPIVAPRLESARRDYLRKLNRRVAELKLARPGLGRKEYFKMASREVLF